MAAMDWFIARATLIRPAATRDCWQAAAEEPSAGGGEIEQGRDVEPGGGRAARGAAEEQAVGERDGPLVPDDLGFVFVQAGELKCPVDGFFLKADLVDELVGERLVRRENLSSGELIELVGILVEMWPALLHDSLEAVEHVI